MKIDTTTKREVVDKLHKLQDAIDVAAAKQMEDESLSNAAVDRLEALVLQHYDAIESVIRLLEMHQDAIWPDIADKPAEFGEAEARHAMTGE